MLSISGALVVTVTGNTTPFAVDMPMSPVQGSDDSHFCGSNVLCLRGRALLSVDMFHNGSNKKYPCS